MVAQSEEQKGGANSKSRPAPGGKKKCPTCKKGTPLWFISWADMVTLLLCLFVIIVAYSSQDKGKYMELAGSMRAAFAGQNPDATISPIPMGYDVVGFDFHQEVQLVNLVDQIKVLITPMVDNGQAELLEEKDGFILRLNQGVVLEGTPPKLTDKAKSLLDEIAKPLQPMHNILEIRGLAEPGADGKPSWRIATDRVAAIGEYLNRQGGIPAHRLRVVGLGPGGEGQTIAPGWTEIGIMRATSSEGGGAGPQ